MNKILRFEITDRCNQKCNMCWSTNWEHRDMPWENIKNMLIDYSSNFPDGVLVLTSREPLLSPNIEETLALAKKLNLKVKLLTNGTLFNDYYCKIIMDSTIDFISISIHGNEQQHNKITNNINSYKSILAGLKKINEYKEKYRREDIKIRITTVINNQTVEDIDELINIAKMYNTSIRIQHLMWHSPEIKEAHKTYLKKIYNFEDNIIDGFLDNIDIDLPKINQILNYAINKCKKDNVSLQIYPELNETQLNDWYGNNREIRYNSNLYCDHVAESIRVRANGDISLCQYIDLCFGNIKNKSIKDLVNDKNYIQLMKKLANGEIFPICLHCCHLRTKNNNDIINNFKI